MKAVVIYRWKKHFRGNRQTQVIIDVFHVQKKWYLNTSSFFVLQMSKWIEYKRAFFNEESLRLSDSISAISLYLISSLSRFRLRCNYDNKAILLISHKMYHFSQYFDAKSIVMYFTSLWNYFN